MCGDALGDYKAAQSNQVNFYPILVKHEKESWSEFIKTALDKLMCGAYSGEYQDKKLQEFNSNLGN